MKLKSAILLLFFCLAALPANAANGISEEGAGRLKAIFDSMLRDQIKIGNARGNGTLEKQGDVIVEATRNFYAITMPHLQIRYGDGGRFEIGIISINAVPHKPEISSNQWAMTISMPTAMRFYDASNNERMRLSIEGQQAAGIFHEDTQLFSKLDINYDNITVEGANPAYTVAIPKTIMRLDMKPGTDGRWSGPFFTEFQNITAKQKDESKTATIKNLKAAFQFDRFDPTSALTYRKRIINLIDQKAFEAPEMTPQQTQRLSSAIYDIFTKGVNGINASYSLSGLHLEQPASALDAPPETFDIDSAKIALRTSGFLDGNAALGIHYSYNGFNTSTIANEDKNIIPSEANLDIALKNIPFNKLVQIGQNTLASGAAKSPETLQIAGLGLLLKIPAVLSEAGTSIEIKDNFLGNNVYRAAIDGSITANITATNSATAKARGTFKGLDTLIKKLKAIKDHAKQDKINSMLKNLEWIKSLGKKPIGLNPTYTYDFVMDEAGNMLLNGKDIRTLKQSQTDPIAQPEQ